MINLNGEAKKVLEDYLHQVRTYVSLSKNADPEEVLRDINEHIERELQNLPQPVSKDDLELVLKRLGSPQQWVNEEDIPWWRTMALRLRKGPEDWRLAYIAFGVLFIGTLLTGPIGLLAGFCLSRAAVSVCQLEELQVKKWLIYPALVMVYSLLMPTLLFWPAPLLIGSILLFKDSVSEITCAGLVLSFTLIGLALWWGFLWTLVRKFPNSIKTLFHPFAEQWKANWLGYNSIIMFLLGASNLIVFFHEPILLYFEKLFLS